MRRRPELVQVLVTNDVGGGENGSPQSIFIIGEIDCFGGYLDSGDLVKAIQIDADHVFWVAELPGVDHVTDHLSFVGITLTGVNLDPSILVQLGGGAAQVGNVDLPPVRLVAARNKPV